MLKINGGIVFEQVDDELIISNGDKLFRLNDYGLYIFNEIKKGNFDLEEFLNNECEKNNEIDSSFIKNKIKDFINLLLSKGIIENE